MRRIVHMACFIFAFACLGGLAVGLLIEVLYGVFVFESYIGTLSGWAVVLAVIHHFTRPAKK